MGFMKFKEYIDLNKKTLTKPTVDQVADYPGKASAKPEKEKKHKDAGGSGQVGEIPPYSAGKAGKDPNKGKLHDGLGTLGNKDLVYKAEDGWYGGKDGVSKSEQGIPGGKKAKDWVATKSEAWVNKTKDLSLTEFIGKIKKEKFTPDSINQPAHKTIQETTELCKSNKKYISDLLREMKRKNVLKSVLKEALNQPESLQILSLCIAENKTITKRFFNSLNEMVAPPVGMEDETEGDEEMVSDEEGFEDEEMPSDEEEMDAEDEGEDEMDAEDEGEDEMDDEDEMPSDEDEYGDEDEMGDEDEEDYGNIDSYAELEDEEDDMAKDDLEDQIENRNPFYVRKSK